MEVVCSNLSLSTFKREMKMKRARERIFAHFGPEARTTSSHARDNTGVAVVLAETRKPVTLPTLP